MEQLTQSLTWFSNDNGTSLFDAVVAMVLSCVLSLLAAQVYKATHKGTSYSSTFVQTLIILGIVISVIMMAVGSSLARAFSLVGALSIVRFRTAIKDSRDIAFVFFVMAIGMTCGTQLFDLAIVFTAFVIGVLLLLFYFNFGQQKLSEQLLRATFSKDIDYSAIFSGDLAKALRSHRLIEVAAVPNSKLINASWVLQLKHDTSPHDFLKRLCKTIDSDNVQLLSGEDHYTI